MINNPFYRKNSDSEIRQLERALLAAPGDEIILRRLCAMYARLNRTRELLALKIKYTGNLIVQNELSRCAKPWANYTRKNFKSIVLSGHTDRINSCSYSPDGSQIVSGSDDGSLRIWDTQTGQIIKVLEEHSEVSPILRRYYRVNCCRYSPNGSQIVSGSNDGTLRIWDVDSSLVVREVRNSGWVSCCCYSPDGSKIVYYSTGGALRILDVNSGQEIGQLRGDAPSIRCHYSPDGSEIISDSYNRILIWDVESSQIIGGFFGHSRFIRDFCYSPDGSQIVSCSNEGTLRIWDTKTGKTIRVLDEHTAEVACCSYSPDGSRIVSGSDDRTLRIWDASSGQEIRVIRNHFRDHSDHRISCCSYSPDGSQIVSGYYNGNLIIRSFPSLIDRVQ